MADALSRRTRRLSATNTTVGRNGTTRTKASECILISVCIVVLTFIYVYVYMWVSIYHHGWFISDAFVLLGEDIAMSDGEDENDPDELEYDDVFVRDNDFGSDVGSDGEVMAKVAMRAAGDERLGPRFALSNRIAIEDRDEICFIFDVNSKRSTVYSAEARGHVEGQCDNELQQLCNYTTVIYAHSESLMPKLGAAPTAESKASKSASTGVKLPCVLENGLPGPETEKTKLQNNSSAKASMEATTVSFSNLMLLYVSLNVCCRCI